MRILALMLCLLYALWAKDTLIIGVENEAVKINPAYSEDHDAVIGLIFSGLVRFDENMKVQPDLAKSWSISQDGLVYEFELRDDVLWHDGVKFSAKDVKFSLEAFKNPKNNAEIYVNFKDIKSVEILNDYKVKITLSKPFVAFLDSLSAGILPAHLLEKENLNTSKFNQNPVGTGAFKFEKWKKGEYVSLSANENFYLGKVKSKKLILRHINDANVAAVELKNSKIDAALIDSSLLKTLEGDRKFKIMREKSDDYRALMINFENEFLKDKNVRLALNYAVNKQAIVDNILHGYGFVASHPLQNSWAAPKEFKSYTYDMKKADELLLKAGFKKNAKGLYEKNGKVLSFDIYTMSNDPLRVSLAGILQSEFKKFGVETKVVAKPSGSFDYSKVDSFLIGWGSPYDPDFHTYRVFESSQDTNKSPIGWNFGHYNDENVDKALEKARNSLDSKERKKHYAEFINALYENPPFIFLTYLDFALVYDANLKGVKPRILGHHGVGFTHNAYEWSKN
ncbi:ABC transporter substrate-binding protein [Campylobacter helveticus]|uniref:ABC transporter substrate-binding protein n=1 Tax=Campylobacter helveticus TaxID=28898 RepID=UPI00242E49CB|nr:ABC transporter substrate-binding protein [Campylobacter helveticus]